MRSAYIFLPLLLVSLALTADLASSLKILGLFPLPARSHFHFFRPLVRGLAEAGHDVDVVSFFPEEQPPPGYTDYTYAMPDIPVDREFSTLENRHFMSHFIEYVELYFIGKIVCNYTLNEETLKPILSRPPGYYDVIILEQFNSDCMMGVAHQLQAPVIALSSCALMPWHYDRMGAPIVPSYLSALFLGRSQEMSFGGRLANWLTLHSMNWMYKLLNVPSDNEQLRLRFGPGLPSTGELVKNTSLFFVNQHYSLTGPRPLPPNVIELGGIQIQPAKPLPNDLQQLLDNAEHGVVLISWGSLMRAVSLPVQKRQGLLRAVARLKQQFIFKWENDTLPEQPANMHVMKWLPQRDILAHPNVKAFISHGGLMGISEAVTNGVPIVGMPLYGDQFLNVANLVQRGMAVQLNYEDINEESVYEAVTKVLDPSYKKSAKRIALAYNERPQTPMQTALWWVEHVAATRGAPLTQPSAVRMSRFVYYSLDVYLVIGVALLLVIFIFSRLLRLCRKGKQQKRKQH